MKVIDILRLLRDDEQKVSLRIDNWFKFVSTKDDFPEEYLEKEVIDIVPNIEHKSIENGCFVINVKGNSSNNR